MSIRIGVYDLFAYMVPGGLYLTNVSIAASALFGFRVDAVVTHLDLTQALLLAFIAYTLGIVVDPVCSRTWNRLFYVKGLEQIVLRDLRERHPEYDLGFEAHDWRILRSYFHLRNREWSLDLDQFNAMNIMLRNLSFGLILLGVTAATYGITTDPVYMAAAPVLAALSLLAGERSVTRKRWFFRAIFETAIAINVSTSDLCKRKDTTEAAPSITTVSTRILDSDADDDG